MECYEALRSMPKVKPPKEDELLERLKAIEEKLDKILFRQEEEL